VNCEGLEGCGYMNRCYGLRKVLEIKEVRKLGGAGGELGG